VKPILTPRRFGIGRNRAHCLRGSFEQEIVDDGLVLVGDGGNPRRQCKYDVEVRDVQQFWTLRCFIHASACEPWHLGQCLLRQLSIADNHLQLAKG